jgi:hypothetical protein
MSQVLVIGTVTPRRSTALLFEKLCHVLRVSKARAIRDLRKREIGLCQKSLYVIELNSQHFRFRGAADCCPHRDFLRYRRVRSPARVQKPEAKLIGAC